MPGPDKPGYTVVNLADQAAVNAIEEQGFRLATDANPNVVVCGTTLIFGIFSQGYDGVCKPSQ
jgi:hypothetical protein